MRIIINTRKKESESRSRCWQQRVKRGRISEIKWKTSAKATKIILQNTKKYEDGKSRKNNQYQG